VTENGQSFYFTVPGGATVTFVWLGASGDRRVERRAWQAERVAWPGAATVWLAEARVWHPPAPRTPHRQSGRLHRWTSGANDPEADDRSGSREATRIGSRPGPDRLGGARRVAPVTVRRYRKCSKTVPRRVGRRRGRR